MVRYINWWLIPTVIAVVEIFEPNLTTLGTERIFSSVLNPMDVLSVPLNQITGPTRTAGKGPYSAVH